MTKQKLNLLVVLMALALAGIIAMQLMWMKNALDVRNELFDRSVNEALVETSRRVETLHEVVMIRDLVGHDQTLPFGYGQMSPAANMKVVNGDTIRHNQPRSRFGRGLNMGNNRSKMISNDSLTLANRSSHQHFSDFDSILSVWEQRIGEQDESNFTPNTKGEGRRGRMRNINPHEQGRMAFKPERLKNTARQMIYDAWNQGIDLNSDTSLINQVLNEELVKREIDIAFQFGVLQSNNSLIMSKGVDSLSLFNHGYMASLYPNNIMGSDERLLVFFPSRKSFVIKSLVFPASLSLLFSVFIMAVFALSIYYIISQKKLSEMKSDFINNMTHEFKTPLATISVATDTILNPKVIADPDKIKQFVGVIKNENLRLNNQVETILQMASLDRHDFDFKFEKVNLNDIIDKAIAGLLLQVESRGGSIVVNKIAVDPVVKGDAQHLLHLFNNLLDNANKYSPERPEIKIAIRNIPVGVWVSVADKGIGMPKQVQQRVFERFFRETSGNVHNVKGFGLGLSYVKAISDAHKGEVKVQSDVGKGSIFEVFLPFSF
ncbi:MAG TPA: HAMP domain-containing sensor histidine kinase [Prolixibacteraceae bacterium]|nr:HAMP domain-containing sensor histidine kinase [Prolixibacteraceae bacterium]